MSERHFTPAAAIDDLPAEGSKAVTVAGRAILLVQSEGALYAVAAICSHADEPLACGRVKRGWIACPAHGARFDLATGDPLGPPATDPIETYPVRVREGVVEIGF